jgi:hypothetical protein
VIVPCMVAPSDESISKQSPHRSIQQRPSLRARAWAISALRECPNLIGIVARPAQAFSTLGRVYAMAWIIGTLIADGRNCREDMPALSLIERTKGYH